MSKTLENVADIVRRVTGRVDQSVSQQVIYNYINDFYSLEAPQETRLFESQGYYEETTTAGTSDYAVDLGADGYTILSDPIWVDGYSVNFYIYPDIFFAKWPETQDYTEQRPTDVLWYNNELVFRAPPDDEYSVKITAYKLNRFFSSGTTPTGAEGLAEDYWFRYIAYGAALDLLADSGEFEKYGQVMPIFERYKGMVNARTYTQQKDRLVIRNF